MAQKTKVSSRDGLLFLTAFVGTSPLSLMESSARRDIFNSSADFFTFKARNQASNIFSWGKQNFSCWRYVGFPEKKAHRSFPMTLKGAPV